MISLFQTAAGSWHIPSILTVAGWLIGSLVTGIFIFANLRVNRDDRFLSHEKEQQSIAKISNLEDRAKDRTISDVQSNLFILLTKDLPKAPIKVFVGVEDNETDRYAQKIRLMLCASGYGTDDIIRMPGGLILDRPEALGLFSSNSVAFFVYGDPKHGVFIYSGDFGYATDNEAVYSIQKLERARRALAKIGLIGDYVPDNTFMKPGDIGIFVPLKNH